VRAEHLTGGGFGFNSGTGRARGRGKNFGKLPGGEAELLRALAGAEMHRSNGSAAEKEVRCGGAGGRGARGSSAPGGFRVRVPRGSGASICRAAEQPRRAGRARGSPGFLGGQCAGKKKEERRGRH
jgi:hypothetical protein